MKKIVLAGMLFLAWTGGAVASPINWVTTSPTQDGVLTYHFDGDIEKVYLGTDTESKHGQPIGIYGAGFYVEFGGVLDFSVDLSTWDSWNSREGYYDQLLVTTSSNGFYWDSSNDPTTEIVVQLGGSRWTDETFEKIGVDNLHLTLDAGEYLSIALEAKYDALFTSEAMGKFNFTANSAPAPVPEPATMILFGTGLVGLAGVAIRRKKK